MVLIAPGAWKLRSLSSWVPVTRHACLSILICGLSACRSSSKAQPPAASPPAGPTVAAASADTAPIVSPDHSVRRATPDEVSAGRAPLASECVGDACSAVAVTWLDPGYRFENRGRHDVTIQIWFAAQGDCLRSTFTIAPTKSRGWGNTGFCKPYRATYGPQ